MFSLRLKRFNFPANVFGFILRFSFIHFLVNEILMVKFCSSSPFPFLTKEYPTLPTE